MIVTYKRIYLKLHELSFYDDMRKPCPLFYTQSTLHHVKSKLLANTARTQPPQHNPQQTAPRLPTIRIRSFRPPYVLRHAIPLVPVNRRDPPARQRSGLLRVPLARVYDTVQVGMAIRTPAIHVLVRRLVRRLVLLPRLRVHRRAGFITIVRLPPRREDLLTPGRASPGREGALVDVDRAAAAANAGRAVRRRAAHRVLQCAEAVQLVARHEERRLRRTLVRRPRRRRPRLRHHVRRLGLVDLHAWPGPLHLLRVRDEVVLVPLQARLLLARLRQRAGVRRLGRRRARWRRRRRR
ncbi:unnamed protein product [Chondrus crispus]|uniref:Uncharacterized protein n=1 Tax=Chondrus crispus TaxID=2769 RepID=R7QIW5_CHOCR|nr:unnamed protein product [Chondrus crispus]CDF38452.1 unnamed protein product [Chondrus crispus]|eukprot:XP_005718345.1 unnamed protein product [Chondrus crispus]